MPNYYTKLLLSGSAIDSIETKTKKVETLIGETDAIQKEKEAMDQEKENINKKIAALEQAITIRAKAIDEIFSYDSSNSGEQVASGFKEDNSIPKESNVIAHKIAVPIKAITIQEIAIDETFYHCVNGGERAARNFNNHIVVVEDDDGHKAAVCTTQEIYSSFNDICYRKGAVVLSILPKAEVSATRQAISYYWYSYWDNNSSDASVNPLECYYSYLREGLEKLLDSNFVVDEHEVVISTAIKNDDAIAKKMATLKEYNALIAQRIADQTIKIQKIAIIDAPFNHSLSNGGEQGDSNSNDYAVVIVDNHGHKVAIGTVNEIINSYWSEREYWSEYWSKHSSNKALGSNSVVHNEHGVASGTIKQNIDSHYYQWIKNKKELGAEISATSRNIHYYWSEYWNNNDDGREVVLTLRDEIIDHFAINYLIDKENYYNLVGVDEVDGNAHGV